MKRGPGALLVIAKVVEEVVAEVTSFEKNNPLDSAELAPKELESTRPELGAEIIRVEGKRREKLSFALIFKAPQLLLCCHPPSLLTKQTVRVSLRKVWETIRGC